MMKIAFIYLLAFSFYYLVHTEPREDEFLECLTTRLKFSIELNGKILELQEEFKEFESKAEPMLQTCLSYTSKEIDIENFNEIMQIQLACLEFSKEYQKQLQVFKERAIEVMHFVFKSNTYLVEPVKQFCGIDLPKEVHAFVKRDAPATAPAKATDNNYLEDLQKQFGDFSKQLNDKFRDTFNADEINKGFSNVVSSVNKAFSDLKPSPEPKKD